MDSVFTGSTERHVVFSETSLAFPLQACGFLSMSLFNNCLGVVYGQGKQRTAWFISRGPWLMERCQPNDLQDIMFWWHTLQRADEMSDGAWLPFWRDASFTCGKELTLPHGGAAIRNLTLRTHFLFTSMDCRTIVSSTHFFHSEKPNLTWLDRLWFCVLTTSWFLLTLPGFAWFHFCLWA